MTTRPADDAWLDQEDARLAQTVRTHRVAVQYVMRGEEADEPPFAYTVGLFGLDHPELVVVGLDHETACGLLNTVAGMVLDGRDLVPGEVIADDDGVDVLTRRGAAEPGRGRCSRRTGSTERPDEFSVPAYQLTWALDGRHLPLGSAATRASRTASRGPARGGREPGQPRPSSRRSLATWPVALTL